MTTEQYIWQTAEAAIAGTLAPEAVQELESRLAADPAFAQAYQECYHMLQGLNDNGRQRRYKELLKEIHHQQAKPATKRRVITFLPAQWRTAAVAAGVAILASVSTMLLLQQGQHKANTSQNIQLLRREIDRIKRSQNQQQQQIESIKGQQDLPVAMQPSNYSGTGIALTNDGYVITNYHVTEGADSVFIQLRNGSYHKARVIAFDPKTDVAVLKVEDARFRFGKGELPYTFTANKAALGAHIYTLGFPQDEIVYNEGYISSRNGFEGDSMQYRLEVSASPGQSGAPVMDDAGNIVAIIRSKDSDATDITYAVSSKALLRLLHDLPRQTGLRLPKANRLSNFSRAQQIEKLQDYTCMVQVYKK